MTRTTNSSRSARNRRHQSSGQWIVLLLGLLLIGSLAGSYLLFFNKAEKSIICIVGKNSEITMKSNVFFHDRQIGKIDSSQNNSYGGRNIHITINDAIAISKCLKTGLVISEENKNIILKDNLITEKSVPLPNNCKIFVESEYIYLPGGIKLPAKWFNLSIMLVLLLPSLLLIWILYKIFKFAAWLLVLKMSIVTILFASPYCSSLAVAMKEMTGLESKTSYIITYTMAFIVIYVIYSKIILRKKKQ